MDSLYVSASIQANGGWCAKERLIFLRDALNTLLPDRYPNDVQVSNE